MEQQNNGGTDGRNPSLVGSDDAVEPSHNQIVPTSTPHLLFPARSDEDDQVALDFFHWLSTRRFLDSQPVGVKTALKKIQDCVGAELIEPIFQRLRLIRINELRFRKREDLRNLLTSFYKVLYSCGSSLFYIIRGFKGRAEIYVGLYGQANSDNAFRALKSTIAGILPGTRIEDVSAKLDVSTSVKNLIVRGNCRAVITGVPSQGEAGSEHKNEKLPVAGVERLFDSMGDADFALLVVADPVDLSAVDDYRQCVANLHNSVHRLAKYTIQRQQGASSAKTEGNTEGGTQTHTKGGGTQIGESIVQQDAILKRLLQGIKFRLQGGAAPQWTNSKVVSTQESDAETVTYSLTKSIVDTLTTSIGVTQEITNKAAASVEEILNRFHQRIEEGRGVGMWKTTSMLIASNDVELEIAGDCLSGLLSGPRSHIDPIRRTKLEPGACPFVVSQKFNACEGHPLGPAFEGLYTYLTTTELAMVADLPAHDLPGLPVEKITEYARSIPQVPAAVDGVRLGAVMDPQLGERPEHKVAISLRQFNRHCFVTGATGSGKSNTMMTLVNDLWKGQRIPFLVIEPVKSEYRRLSREIPEMAVFTLGGTAEQRLRLNPFDFDPKVGLVSHIDNLKAAFNATFGMYSSMPYILEKIIYEVYKKSGWDLRTGENLFYEKAGELLGASDSGGLRDLFLPKLSDMTPLVDGAIKHFFPQPTDYGSSLLGALTARISSMTLGAKGRLLDSRQSFSMADLLGKPVVIELWPFTDNDEKAFVMALLLIKLYEHRQREYLDAEESGAGSGEKLKHLLIVEEAHRLLSKPSGGSELTGHGREKGVEVFADILAEIRSYGQGIAIVDQIPSKLIPDVLKNTDVKIAHRLVAKDDRETLGASMTMDEDQVRDLARAKPGEATVYFEGLHKPLRVKVPKYEFSVGPTTDGEDPGLRRRLTAFDNAEHASSLALPAGGFSEQEELKAMVVVNGLLTMGLLGALPDTIELRQAAQARLCESSGISTDTSLWPWLASGLHLVADTVSDRLKSVQLGAYLTSVAAWLLRDWANECEIVEPSKRFLAESQGLAFLSAAASGNLYDLLDVCLDNYIELQGVNFTPKVVAALRVGGGKQELDWSELQEELARHASLAVLSFPINAAARVELAMRFLSRLPSQDQHIAELAGVALQSLRLVVSNLDDFEEGGEN